MSAADDEDRTVFLPGGTAAPPVSSMPPSAAPAPPRREGSGIRESDVLNHIFQVRRFIARGGMGEVFEGVNVNSDERVAIKVMLPALAADANIQTMFRKEARTLTRLSNPALVQYRVLAHEPQLDVLYIVTEYIDGQNLCDLLGSLHPSARELIALTRRLATGLDVAHGLGAIHRDISPDNVLLEDGRLDRAKVIDFGIAKDLDPGAKTVVGDGFAGKLGYVAPEQLGDFDRQVGPWTDVYSLGLVILAVAQGRNPDLSGSFVDAINKRRAGPDMAGVPPELAPVLRQMLVPDPAARLRSMEAVIAAIDAPLAPPAAAPGPKAAKVKAKVMPTAGRPVPPARGGKMPLIATGAGGAVLLLAGLGYLAFGGSPGPRPVTAPVVATGSSTAIVRASVTRALPGIGCSWLDVTGVDGQRGGAVVRLAGAAGDPAAAEAAVAHAVEKGGGALASSDFSEVAPVSSNLCQSIDAFRRIRSDGAPLLSVAQRKFEMSKLPDDSQYKGQIGARAVLNLDIGNPRQQFALYGLEPSGEVDTVVPDREAFAGDVARPGDVNGITGLGGDRYRFPVDVTHTGWSGFLLLTGDALPEHLIATPNGKRAPDWPQQFARTAAAHGWKAQMVWFKTVDELPN